MDRLIIFLFFGLIAFAVISNPSKSSSSQNNSSSINAVVSQSVSSEHHCSGCGTTRCTKFQADYEEAVRKYDEQNSGLPRGLLLPNGKTVGEVIDSNQVYGK